MATFYIVNELKYFATQGVDVCWLFKIFTSSIKKPPKPQVKIDFLKGTLWQKVTESLRTP
jgi:hypothetical protein